MGTAQTNKRTARQLTSRRAIEKSPPRAAKLRALAKKNPPPQAWFEQTDNPFQPSK